VAKRVKQEKQELVPAHQELAKVGRKLRGKREDRPPGGRKRRWMHFSNLKP